MKKGFVVIIVILAMFSALACDISGPDPWFSENLEIDQKDLPSEIVHKKVRGQPVLINIGNYPFYIIEKDQRGYPNSEVSDGFKPLNKIVANKSFFYYMDDYGKTQYRGYIQMNDQKNNPIEYLVIEPKHYGSPALNTYLDDRPDNVSIPLPKDIIILAYYRGKTIKIHGNVMFSINDDYNPNQGQEGIEECATWVDDDTVSNFYLKIFKIFFMIFAIYLIVLEFKQKLHK